MAELLNGPTEPDLQKLGDEALVSVFASARGLADPNPFYRTLREKAPRLISFTPRRVEGLRERVGVLVDERLDELAAAGTADVMKVLAERAGT